MLEGRVLYYMIHARRRRRRRAMMCKPNCAMNNKVLVRSLGGINRKALEDCRELRLCLLDRRRPKMYTKLYITHLYSQSQHTMSIRFIITGGVLRSCA